VCLDADVIQSARLKKKVTSIEVHENNETPGGFPHHPLEKEKSPESETMVRFVNRCWR